MPDLQSGYNHQVTIVFQSKLFVFDQESVQF